MKYLPKTNQAGFSLVETLVAITILMIVVIGPLKISSSVARSTSYSSEQVIAFFLAQEGVELAQKARDDLLLDYYKDTPPTKTPWTEFKRTTGTNPKYSNCFAAAGCGLEQVESGTGVDVGALKTQVDCTTNASPYFKCKLYYKDGGDRARYTYAATGNIDTGYTRVITMTDQGAGVKVVSTVTWRTGNQRNAQTAVAETYLFNVYNLP